jgi:hypothetical protein
MKRRSLIEHKKKERGVHIKNWFTASPAADPACATTDSCIIPTINICWVLISNKNANTTFGRHDREIDGLGHSTSGN